MRLTSSRKNAPGAVSRSLDGTNGPTAAQVTAGQVRQERLNLVLAHGCIDCAGAVAVHQGGSRLLCALAVNGLDAPPCGVPDLYAALHDGTRQEVAARDVQAARDLTEVENA